MKQQMHEQQQKMHEQHQKMREQQQKMREQQQKIAQLNLQLKEHQEELKKKDHELVSKEISEFQRMSLNTPVTGENKFNGIESDCESNKMPLSENTTINSPFNQSNGQLRPQSLYINTPNRRPLSSHDLFGKDRHRNPFTTSNNQLHLSRSSSTTPDR
jgi:chromosome segregation ATPase